MKIIYIVSSNNHNSEYRDYEIDKVFESKEKALIFCNKMNIGGYKKYIMEEYEIKKVNKA